MLKHRGPILEQQTSIPANEGNFSVQNAKTSSETYPLLGRQAAVPRQGDGLSAVSAWKQAFCESRNGMGGRGDFLNILSTTIIYYHVAGRVHSLKQASFGGPLGLRASGDARSRRRTRRQRNEPGPGATPRQRERKRESAGSIVSETPRTDERTHRAPGGKKCVTCFRIWNLIKSTIRTGT